MTVRDWPSNWPDGIPKFHLQIKLYSIPGYSVPSSVSCVPCCNCWGGYRFWAGWELLVSSNIRIPHSSWNSSLSQADLGRKNLGKPTICHRLLSETELPTLSPSDLMASPLPSLPTRKTFSMPLFDSGP